MSIPLDQSGTAREALADAVRDYGVAVLDNPQLLSNILRDLLPDTDRERSLLIAAAESGAAQSLRERVAQQGMTPDAAVNIATASLTECNALDPGAARWVVAEFAIALGYQVSPMAAMPDPTPGQHPGPIPAGPQPGSAETQTGPSPFPVYGLMAPPVAPVGETRRLTEPGPQPPQGPYHPQPHDVYPNPGWPRQGPYPVSVPGPTPGSSRVRNRVIGASAVAGVLVIYLIASAVGHLPPFSKPVPPPVPRSSTPSPTTPTPTPSPTHPSPNHTVMPVAALLPHDLTDTATQCTAATVPADLQLTGLVSALNCADPGLPGGSIFAYQFDNAADYLTSWQAYNSWVGFSARQNTGVCPLTSTGANVYGSAEYKNAFVPTYVNGQVLECLWVGTNVDQPKYAWTYPSQYAFISAQGASGSSFADLHTWWTNYGAPAPTASPS